MNKKIFTLLATSLMLFLTAFMMNAQPWWGKEVTRLPKGSAETAYHLQVTHLGFSNPVDYNGTGAPGSIPFSSASQVYLSLDRRGFLDFVSPDSVAKTYNGLRSALWCVRVFEPEEYGQVPTYHFMNKEQMQLLSVDSGRWIGDNFGPMGFTSQDIWSQRTGRTYNADGTIKDNGTVQAFVDGYHQNWAFSRTYNTSPMEPQAPLRLEIEGEKDYFMTFAFNWSNFPPTIQLVKVHARDLDPAYNTDFYRNNLLFFRLVTAAPRVLTAADFNTRFGESPSGPQTLKFSPDTKNAVNILSQPLLAELSTTVATPTGADPYLRLRTNTTGNNTYIYVADGDTAANYYNVAGKRYPILRQTTWGRIPAGRGDFRFVYYPSEDSLIMNVRRIDHIDDAAPFHEDDGSRIAWPGLGDGFYNMEILNFLIVKLQDLVTVENTRVITVYDAPAHTRINFGNRGCIITDDRTTVPPNLYVIRDSLGRYLVMPLEVGDFTPRWMYLNENEKPLKTPSYQWLVVPENNNSVYSPIRLVNREFAWVSIRYSQIYKSFYQFNGYIDYYDPLTPQYGNIDNVGAKVKYSGSADADGFIGSFKVVLDDPDVAAVIEAGDEDMLTQDQWQRRYRTSPYIGYKFIAKDTLHYYSYAFNYLQAYNRDFYLYTPELGKTNANGTQDTTLYVAKNKNHFRLHLPDTLKTYGAEAYGIGYADNYLTWKETEDIAKLVRYYYYFQQNDYWNFAFDQNYLTLDRNGRYVFSEEERVNMNPFQRAKFYLRFTYQPDDMGPIKVNQGVPEYYALLHRVNESNFTYINNELGTLMLQRMKMIDASHGKWATSGYGVLAASVDDWNLYVRAQTKTLGLQRASTFALSRLTEPLYRRFNNVLVDTDCGDTGSDVPRTLKIYRTNNPFEDYIFEDQYSANSYGKLAKNWNWKYIPYSGNGIHFGGVESKSIHAAEVARDVQHREHGDYAIYVDTAYVNRGTGHIKPQYLLAVGPKFYNAQCTSCDIPITPATYGRYLMNMTDSARVKGFDPDLTGHPTFNKQVRDPAYLWNDTWDRLAFVPAVHVGDTLYILNVSAHEAVKWLEDNFIQLVDNDEPALNYIKLGNHPLVDKRRLDNNLHKDYVWSMRFYERGNYEDFLLESETTNRSTATGPMIAPMFGGWVRLQNQEMVINRGSYWDAILDAEKWNTECANMAAEEAVGNEAVAAVKVVAGTGSVTILNAAGRQVVISNVLGQTVAKAVLTSDNATVDAPKGVLVVAVEGESAVKAVVK